MFRFVLEKWKKLTEGNKFNPIQDEINRILAAYPEEILMRRPYDYESVCELLPFHVCLHEAGHFMMAKKYKLQINSIRLKRILLDDRESVRGSVVSLEKEEYETEPNPYVSFVLGGCMGEICSFSDMQDLKNTRVPVFYEKSSIGDAKRAVNKQFKLQPCLIEHYSNEIESGEERTRNAIFSLVREHCQTDLDFMFKNSEMHDFYARNMYKKWRAKNFQNTALDSELEIDNWID